MAKILKAAGWTAVALAAAAAAGALALKIYFTPQRLKAITTDYASRNLKREVSFDSVSIGLPGLKITNLRVSEFPDFKKGEFFSAASFSARPDLRRLLRGELKINSVSASGLSMRVTELRPEVYNFSDLIEPGEAPKPRTNPAKAKAAPARPLHISSLKVRDSSFVYTNADGDLKVTLRDIDLAAAGISPEGLFPVEASFTLGLDSPYFKGDLPASLGGRLSLGGFDPARGSAEIDKASLSFGKVSASFRGSLKNLIEPDASLRLEIAQFSTADLRKAFPALPPKILLPEIEADADFKLTGRDVRLRSVKLQAGPLKASLKGSAAWAPAFTYNLSAEIKAQVPEMDTTLLARKAKGYPVPSGLKLPLAEIAASLRLRPGHADAPSFTLESSPLSAAGKVFFDYSGKQARTSGRFKATVKDLSRLAAIAPEATKDYSLTGAAVVSADFSYSGSPSVKGRAELKGAGALFAGHRLESLSGTLDFTEDSAAARKLSGTLDGGAFTAAFRASDLLKRPKADFDLDLARLVLPDLPPPGPDKKPAQAAGGEKKPGLLADISGRLKVSEVTNANFSCRDLSASLALTGVSADLRSLDGKAGFTAGPGKFSGLYALAERSKAAKVALYPVLVLQKASRHVKGVQLPDFDNLDFDLMEGDYSFAGGNMKLNKSSLKAPAADVSSSGSINLPAEKLDMRIDTRLKAASGIRMSAPIALNVTGTFSDPSVKPDVRSIAEQPAVKKAIEKIAPSAEKLLKGLFK